MLLYLAESKKKMTPGKILSFKHVNLLGLGKHYLTARHANIGNFRVSLSQQLICSSMTDDFKSVSRQTFKKCIAIPCRN